MIGRTALSGAASLASIALALGLTGCAGLQIHQLDPASMKVIRGTPNGAVYFLPKPYLLVTRLPDKVDASSQNQDIKPNAPVHKKAAQADTGHGEGQLKGAPPPGGDDSGSPKSDSGSTPAPAAPGGGSDFIAQTSNYVLKLVYLPDYAHPMSITATAGIGTAKLTPTFQNGWMLTGFTSEADSKASEMVQQVAGLIGSATKAVAPGGGPSLANVSGPSDEVLKPGLYEFEYDIKGHLLGLCPVDYFTSGEMIVPKRRPACFEGAVNAPKE